MTRYPDNSTKTPKVSSPFGPRSGGAFGTHYGADLIGFTDAYAANGGKVTFAGWANNNAGNTVIVSLGGGVEHLYMHLASVAVTRGANIAEGAHIGKLGHTGNATGDCLHFEVRVNGKSVEPLGWIAARIAPATADVRSVRKGDKGPLVGAVQARLKRDYPLYAGHLVVDEDFGAKTDAVVREFQRRAGLVVDGVAGPKTLARLGL